MIKEFSSYCRSTVARQSLGYWPLLMALASPACSHAQSVTSLSISPGQPSVAIGATTQLSATAGFSDGSSKNVSGSVSWSSADARTVNVSSSGLAFGSATGTVTVYASYQGKTASAPVTSSVGSVQWSGPINITQGGTYTGNWKSSAPGKAAVTISTNAPVTIVNSYISSAGNLISDPVYGNKLTVKNVVGIGVNPNVKYASHGLFVDAQHPALLDVENCYFENVLFGVYVRGYGGNRDGTQTIRILNNRGRNIIGLESDGNNGYLPGTSNWQWAHAIQLSEIQSVPGMRIAWNEIINYPFKSLVNENLNMYDSSGTASSPLLINDNYIQGAYAYNPAVDSFNGGGISTDGGSFDTAQTATAFNSIYNNQVVATVNVGIEIGTGHDNVAHDNRVIASGLLPDGTHIPTQNVGITLYDVYGNASNGSMYNNTMYNNQVGWMCWAARCAWDGYRNDEWFPGNGGLYSTNPSIAGNPITANLENAEYGNFLSKLSSNNVTVGPTMSSQNSNPPPSSGGGGGTSGGSTGSTSISSTAWYAVVNSNSTLCLDAAGTGDGTTVLQNSCGSSQGSQQWQFQPTDSGYYKVISRPSGNKGWDVTGGYWQVANSVKIQIWTAGGNTNQQWMPVSLGNGQFKFIARNSSKCMDIPGASSNVGLQVQQYDCNGTGAQSFTLQQK